MNVLVTGGAGFIGSHLVEALVAAGHRVRVLDDFSSGKRENLAAVANDVEVITGDVRDYDCCARACAGVERVWHLAAFCSVPLSVEHPLDAHHINITGTLHMLLAARDAGVRRLVFASSSAVYGADPQLPCSEERLPLPVSPYAVTKLAGEKYVCQFPALYGMEAVALRFFNIFGPRQEPNSQYASVVPAFLAALHAGRQPLIYGDGEQTREFTFVLDCVQANLLAGLRDGDGIVGEFFNVAVGYTTTVNALLATVQDALGTTIPAQYVPERPGDVRYSQSCIEKITTRLGFAPAWSLTDGVRRTAEWFTQWAAEKASGVK